MAYNTKYRVQFTNELSEEVEVLFKQKDAAVSDIQDYAAVSVKISYAGTEGKMTTVLGASIEVVVNILPADADYWDDFVNAEKDDWLCEATCDGLPVFHGYVLLDESTVVFQDRPYDATIIAVDGLSLLKDIPLVRSDGSSYTGSTNKVINYIASCLLQTGLVLPIRVYDNLFHTSMLDRNDDKKWAWMEQAFLEYRTFLKDATTFVDCYTALNILLTDTHRLFYWKGQWVIVRLSLYQYVPYVNYYTVYDYNGANAVGFEVTEDYATVGKNELIYPHGNDQNKTVKKAVKSTKTIFNFNVWPEIPKNSKFDRGAQLGTGVAFDEYDLDGDGNTTETIGTYTNYQIADWNFRKNVSGFPRPTDPTTSAQAYRKIIKNEYDVELLREIILEAPTGADVANANNLWSEGIPVIHGDKFSVSFDYRLEVSGTGSFRPVTITLIADNGDVYYVNNQGTTPAGPFYWTKTASSGYIPIFYDPSAGDNVNKYHSYTIAPNGEIPVSGKVYIGLSTMSLGASARFKNIQVDYKPYVAGGYIAVKGEYWLTSQDRNYPDTSEQEVFLSDNVHQIFKGVLLNGAGVPLTPSWYRMGLSESHPYNWYTNNAKFNHEYRRFWFIEGSFTSTKYAPSNQQENQQPLSLHKSYRFVDIPDEDRRFMITAPLLIDLVKGWTSAKFHEALANPKVRHVIEPVTSLIARIIATLNAVTESDWNSASGAPAHGSAGFPPAAFTGTPLLGSRTDAFGVQNDIADTMTANVVNIGGSTLASIDMYYNIVASGTRISLFEIGGTLRDGDIFTFHLYGHDVGVSVGKVAVLDQQDGLQLGAEEFKYIF